MIKDALIAVQNALVSLPGIKYVAEDWGQLDFYDKRPPVQFPCALLDAEGADYVDRSCRSQQAEATINVRLADFHPVNTSAMAPDAERPFEIFDLLTAIHKALQGLSGATFTGLSRTKLRRVGRDDAIREWVLTFRFGFVDNSAMPPVPQAQPINPGVRIATSVN